MLADTQLRFRDAVVRGDAGGIASLLIGGCEPLRRLAIHQRNYQASLVNAILGKFPATAWLLGTPFVAEAAQRFVCEHPPQAPCIAEYAEDFPRFLSEYPAAGRTPYVGAFARLEWHIGQVAIAADRPGAGMEAFSMMDPNVLPDTALTLQDGVRYLEASWPIDDLMTLYLTESAPDRFEFAPFNVWIEVRGARGEFHIDRLDAAEFIFRKSILGGRSIGDAAERALGVNASFDPGQALGTLITAGLVRAFAQCSPEEKP